MTTQTTPTPRNPCLPPPLPRAQWESHPNFPTQALLLRSHENFRAVSRALLERAEAAERQLAEGSPALRERLTASLYLYLRWTMGMRGHEHYEESKLYPWLAHRYGVSTEAMEGEHESLHLTGDAVSEAYERAIEALGDDGDPDVAARRLSTLRAALKRHDDTLLDHLEHEEDTVIPLLLHLPRDEFRRYYEGTIQTLLTQSRSCAEGCA